MHTSAYSSICFKLLQHFSIYHLIINYCVDIDKSLQGNPYSDFVPASCLDIDLFGNIIYFFEIWSIESVKKIGILKNESIMKYDSSRL